MPGMRAAIAAGVALVAVVVIAVLVAVGGDGDDPEGAAAGSSTTTSAPASTVAPATTGPGGGPTTAPPSTPGTTGAPQTAAPRTTVPRTTITAPPRTTAPGVTPNNPPVVTIGPPNPLDRFEAFFNASSGRFIASVPLTANVTDPEGDAFTVDWFSSLDGYIGSGRSITAGLSPDLDTSQPVITARATDVTGAVGEGSIQIIVWIRSDE